MPAPELYHLDALRKLRGDAYVTFPAGDLATRTVERVFDVPRDKVASPDAFSAPEGYEYSGTQLTDQHFTGGDHIYVEVYQKWETLPGSILTTKSIGSVNLVPQKYWRQIRTIETNQPVGPGYVFPAGLTGDQTQIKLIQETITRARLTIISEVISDDESPLLGADSDEWAKYTIYEQVVEEGTPIDTGYFVKKSSVTPFGDGKAIKITMKYASAVAGAVLVTNRGTGYTSAPTVTPSAGTATFQAIVFAGKVIDVQVVDPGGPYLVPPTLAFSGGGGSGAAATAILSIANRLGQDYNQQYDAPIPFRDLNVPAGQGIGVLHAEVNPIDSFRSRMKIPDTALLDAVLGNFVMSYPGKINIDFPDRLVSATALIESALGEGNSEETGSAGVSGLSSVSLSLRGTAQASASIVPDVYPGIEQFWGNNIDCTHIHFFLKNPVVRADVIAKLTSLGITVVDWPKFNPQQVTFVCVGQKLSLQVNASSQGSKARGEEGSSDATGGGTGYSKETGVSIKTVKVSSTIHAGFAVSGLRSSSESVSADASAFAEGVGPSKSLSKDGTVYSRITPETVDPTPGDTDWPGPDKLLLKAIDPDPFKYGWIQFHVVIVGTVDFPSSAPAPPTALYYNWPWITRLEGAEPDTDLDGQNMASYAEGTVFEVDISGRGTSKWQKQLWTGGGSPLTDGDAGTIVPLDYNASTMNYVLIRIEGW